MKKTILTLGVAISMVAVMSSCNMQNKDQSVVAETAVNAEDGAAADSTQDGEHKACCKDSTKTCTAEEKAMCEKKGEGKDCCKGKEGEKAEAKEEAAK